MKRRIATPSFSLGSLLFLISLIAISCAYSSHKLSKRDVALSIESQAIWDRETQNAQCVLLIGGDWDLDARKFEKTYRRFAKECKRNGYRPLKVFLEGHQGAPQDPWGICLRLCNDGNIPPDTFDNCGVGHIAWVEDGKLIDLVHVSEFLSESEPARLDALSQRTTRLFERNSN